MLSTICYFAAYATCVVAMHGSHGEDPGVVPAALLGIVYTTCEVAKRMRR